MHTAIEPTIHSPGPCLKLYHVRLSLEKFCIEEATIHDFYSIWNHQTLSQLSKHTQDGQIKQCWRESIQKWVHEGTK